MEFKNFFILQKDNENFEEIYKKINIQNTFLLDIVEFNGFGFYQKYINDIFDKQLPKWYIEVLENKINKLIIKNLQYISLESIGYKLLKELLDNRTLTIENNKIEIDNKIEIIVIIDEETLEIQKLLQKKEKQNKLEEKYKKYILNFKNWKENG